MQRPFYKSLDREFEIFGIKGKWVSILITAAAVSVGIGLVIGFILGTGMAIVSIILLIVLAVIGCMMMQTNIPSRQVKKAKISSRMEGWVIRRETLSRMLLPDPRMKREGKQ